jgi:hypothetical protein
MCGPVLARLQSGTLMVCAKGYSHHSPCYHRIVQGVRTAATSNSQNPSTKDMGMDVHQEATLAPGCAEDERVMGVHKPQAQGARDVSLQNASCFIPSNIIRFPSRIRSTTPGIGSRDPSPRSKDPPSTTPSLRGNM